MKKLLFGVLGLVVALAAAVLIIPGFIDWNDYKAEIAAQAKAVTGRALIIDGNIKLTLLPAPALVASDVRLANLEGAAVRDMVRLKSLQIRIALGPLLGGNFQVETLKLIEPVIELETLADGRTNWIFAEGEDDLRDSAAPAAREDGTDDEGGVSALRPRVRVDSFVIVNGSLIYRDSRNGSIRRIEELNAHIAAASLTGPFESTGQLRVGGFSLEYAVSIGKIIHGRTVPFTMRLDVAAAAASVQVDGALVGLASTPKMKGTVKVRGANLAGLVNTLAAAGRLPGVLSQPFELEGSVVAAADHAEIKEMTMRLGDTQATGSVSVGLGEKTAVAVELALARVDLDRWLSLPPDDGLAAMAEAREKSSAADRQTVQRSNGQDKASIPLEPLLKMPRRDGPSGGFAIPDNLNGSFRLSADAVTFRGGLIRQVRANAELAAGEITISQLSAQFPGSSEIALFGFVSAVDGQPAFEGEIECSISDLRRVMGWLGVTPPPVPADRLRKLTLNSRLKVSAGQVDFSDLILSLDSSRLTGAVTVALRKRLAFGANVTIDRLNLDAYLPPSAAGSRAKTSPTTGATPAPAGKRSGDQGAATAWRVLTGIDANLVARIESLVYNRTPIKGVVFDGILFNGGLEVRRASVANLAGATVTAKGKIKGFPGVPEISGLTFEASAGNLSRLFRLFGIEPPVPLKKLGKVALKGTAEGSILQPRFGLAAQVAGARIEVTGSAVLLSPSGPTLVAKVKVRHPDLPRLLRALDVNYRPAKAKFGGLNIAATVRGGSSALTYSEVSGNLGPVSVAGGGTLDFGGPRPKFTATMQTGAIIVQDLLPAARTALAPTDSERLFGRPGVVPASWPAPPPLAIRSAARPAAVGGPWPRTALDLSALKSFDANVKVKSAAITFQQYKVLKTEISATLADGVLRAERITGLLYGGPLVGKAVVSAAPIPRIDAALNVKNVSVRQALKAVTGKDMASGTIDLDVTLTGGGRSIADIVATLGGGGRLALRKLDVRGSARGTALAGVLDLMVGLNQLGGGKRGALADITASFNIARGVARSRDMRLVSSLGEGRAEGMVDLSKWIIDVNGEMRLSKNVLTEILSQVTKTQVAAQVLPFRISGNLDAPKVKIDTSAPAAAGRGVALPGIDRLLKKNGLGGLLQQLIPGARQPAPRTQDQPPPPDAQQEPPPPPTTEKKLRPEDILKGLFKKFR